MRLARLLARAVLILVCTVGGYVLTSQTDWVKPSEIGLFMGFGLAMFVLLVEVVINKFSVKIIIGGTVGLIVGLGIAFLISYPLGKLLESAPMALSLYTITACVFGYIGVNLGSGKIAEIRSTALSFLSQEESAPGDKIIDTSALIDGRVAEVVEAGFLEGRLIVPQFILTELQAVADAADPLKRQRGRRGLEILGRIKDSKLIQMDMGAPDSGGDAAVDQKLVALARRTGAALITTDYNLHQVAQLQGVKVLNLNQLAKVMKPVVLPGERFIVQIVKEGKSQGQGVGYLEDGTMVVIDNARRFIGQAVEVAVTSVLQTSAGQMIFSEIPEASAAVSPHRAN